MKLLLLTMYASGGGVPAITRDLATALAGLGHDVTVAFSPYRAAWPHLARPFRYPQSESIRYLGFPAVVVGSYIPQLEATRYLPHAGWRKLLDRHDGFAAALGSVLPAFVLAATGRPAFCWAATPYLADRADRMRLHTQAHAVLDRCVEVPICERIERFVLRKLDIVSLSSATEAAFRAIEPDARLSGVLGPPVDTAMFQPGAADESRRFRIGFVGRIEDPRKNIELLIRSASILRKRRVPVEVHVVGGVAPSAALELAARQGVTEVLHVHPHASTAELQKFYRSLDVLVIPSRQEGLGIVGLEAMASGVPVVSTRCGGPSDYVRNGENGFLTGFEPEDLADAIQEIVGNTSLRARLRDGARRWVVENNSEQVFREKVAQYTTRLLKRP